MPEPLRPGKIVFDLKLQEEDKGSFLDDIQEASNDTIYFQAEENLGGGVVSSKSFMFDGKEWTELAPMSSPRANPACTLVDMDDGEVFFYIYCHFLFQCLPHLWDLNLWIITAMSDNKMARIITIVVAF